MPRLMIRCGASPEISAPSNFIEPEVGGNVPDSMLKIVLLPEPLGPIRPRISPRSTLNDTLLTALKPPNCLTRPSTTSTAVPSVDPGPLTCSYRSCLPVTAAQPHGRPGSSATPHRTCRRCT